MKRTAALSVLFGTLLLLGTSALAATFEHADTFSLAQPVGNDLYVSGGTIQVGQDIQGDLFVVGGRVDVQNNVAQSVNVLGGNVTIVSKVGDDVRVAGGDVVVRGIVGGDLLVAGGNVTIGKDSVVLGDVYVGGGNVVLKGTVGKNINARGGSISLEGLAHGNVDIAGNAVSVAAPVEGNARIIAETLSITPAASFKGSVDYWTRSGTANFGDTLAGGQKAVFHPEFQRLVHEPKKGMAAFFVAMGGVFTLLSLLSAAVYILLLVFFTKTFFGEAAKYLQRKPWKSFGIGLLFLILMPVLIVMLFLTLVGIPLAFLAIAMYVFTLFFSVPLTAMIVAKWIESTYKQKWNKPFFFGVSFGLFIILKLLGFIPILGWIAKGILIMMGLGALLATKTMKLKKIV